MDWITPTPAPLAAPRRQGLTSPDREDWIILPLRGNELLVVGYEGWELTGETFLLSHFKECAPRVLRSGDIGAVAVLVTDDHEECGTGYLVGWLKRLARERGFHVSVFFVPGFTARQALDQLRTQAEAFISRRSTRH